MKKKPHEYSADDFSKIMFKQININVGPTNTEEITDTFEGQLIECRLSANLPYLPVSIYFQPDKGEKRRFNIYEIKSISFEDK